MARVAKKASPGNRSEQVENRDGNGRFMKGQSGNPRGTPSKTAALRKKLETGANGAIKAVLDAAKKGDMTACRLILERVVPSSKPVYQPIAFDLDDSDLPTSARSILRAVADGVLPADQGKLLLDGLASMAKVIEVSELADKVAELEKVLGA